MKAIRKKMSVYMGKNWFVIMKLLKVKTLFRIKFLYLRNFNHICILKLLEACSNNCNRKFQVQLASKDFLQELKTMIGPKLQPTLAIQNKVLFLIQVIVV